MSSRTQILITIIGLVGTLGAALFANWEKVFPTNGDVTTTSPIESDILEGWNSIGRL